MAAVVNPSNEIGADNDARSLDRFGLISDVHDLGRMTVPGQHATFHDTRWAVSSWV
jgi:hypothetical protein